MKFNCGPSPAAARASYIVAMHQEIARLRRGFRKFALLPVRVGEGECRWLEHVIVRYPYAELVGQDFVHLQPYVDLGKPEYRAL